MQISVVRKRIIIAFFIALISILIAVTFGSFTASKGLMPKQIAQAIVFSVLVIISFGYIRKKQDKFLPKRIGLNNLKRGLLCFMLGMSIFLIPLTLTLAFVSINDLGIVDFNLTNNNSIVIGLLTVFLFEAFPEEFVFRGYIFSNINTEYSNWKAGLISVILFVLFPVVLFLITSNFSIEGTIGGQNSITLPFIITLVFFGCFTTYLRILTKSIWTGVGFHLLFVYMNKLIGSDSDSFIQISNVVNQNQIRNVLIISLLTVFLLLIIYPIFSKHKVKWMEKNT